MERLITPLTERADEWRRGCNSSGALGREHARECKRARAELKRRDIQERKEQLEEMEEKAESEVAMLAEVGHLQEGTEQLERHSTEPRSLPPASLQVICDVKCCYSGWEISSAPHSPSSSRLGSRKSSLTSICSLTAHSDRHDSTVSCSTPISSTSSGGATPAPTSDSLHCLTQSPFRLASVCSSDSGFRSQDALQRPSLYVDNGSDNNSVHSDCLTPSKTGDDQTDEGHDLMNSASATWPDLKDTAQFERAASAIMAGRPHTISAGMDRSPLVATI
ncbi:unnamed protein product [Leptidea sinapis]|uniref:Uncharacterized protein n=1 Tax=Leptidea sinapis TaxID=189913 RepID=A0A5E4Q9V5_9NEOP|nr:unnamed protein product [Leptidea sinapis]